MDQNSSSSPLFLEAPGSSTNSGTMSGMNTFDSFLNWDFEPLPESHTWSMLGQPTLSNAACPLPIPPNANHLVASSSSDSIAYSNHSPVPLTPAEPTSLRLQTSDATMAVVAPTTSKPSYASSTMTEHPKVECPCCRDTLNLVPGASLHAHVAPCFLKRQMKWQAEGTSYNIEQLRHVQSSISKLDLSTRLGMMESFYRLSKSHIFESRLGGSSNKGMRHGHEVGTSALPITAKTNLNDNGVLELLYANAMTSTKKQDTQRSVRNGGEGDALGTFAMSGFTKA